MSVLFLDTEFTSLDQTGQLLSLSLVDENDTWFYAVFTDVDHGKLKKWVLDNVVPNLKLTAAQLNSLPPGQYVRGSTKKIVEQLRLFLGNYGEVIVWADVPAFDWVFFCQLFGGAFGLPKNVHYIVRDLAVLFEVKGYGIDTSRSHFLAGEEIILTSDGRLNPKQLNNNIPHNLGKHNALSDAIVGFRCYKSLMREN